MPEYKNLLEFLVENVDCGYISNLLYLSAEDKSRLSETLRNLDDLRFSLEQWNEALSYLVGAHPLPTIESVKERLCRWLSE